MFKSKFTGYQAGQITRSEKCLLKNNKLGVTVTSSLLSPKQNIDLEQCVHRCEVEPLNQIISHIVIDVIQNNLLCTAFEYRTVEKRCYLYQYGEFSSSSVQYISRISGLCPKGTNIKSELENNGFYCDINGKTDLIEVK